MIRTISTAELAQRLDDPRVVIVDVRPIAAYNGWRLQGEVRGGHIHGAVTCPQSWTELLGPDELQTLLASKGVVPEKWVVVYGYDRPSAEALVRHLEKHGYDEVKVYQAGFPAWANDSELPVQRLARYESLVHPQWVHNLISEQEAHTNPINRYVLCHVTFGARQEYEQEHIPGAVHLDTNDLEDDRDRNRRSPAELLRAAISHGITRDTTVVLYGRNSNPNMSQAQPARKAGQLAAARAANILMYAGVEDVRLLDGGFDAWLAAGYGSEKGKQHPVPVPAFGGEIPARPSYILYIDEVRSIPKDPHGVLVNFSNWREFKGDTSGYHYIGLGGHIPGAIWGNGGTDAHHMHHYRNVDNTMREYHEIAANWQAAGITPDKRVTFYCGTGWRASETFFYAYLLGWPDVAVYDGGWFEWSADPANPIETRHPMAGRN